MTRQRRITPLVSDEEEAIRTSQPPEVYRGGLYGSLKEGEAVGEVEGGE